MFWMGWIVLLFNFVLHFILRAYWVGLVGLSSVFPEGIKYDDLPNCSDAAKAKVRKRLPSFPDYASTLDRICSVIFAFSFALVLIYLAITLTFFVLLSLYIMIPVELRPFEPGTLFAFVSLFFIIPALGVGLLNMKWAQKIPLAVKIKDSILEVLAIFLFHVFRNPIEDISLTFTSYYSLKKNYLFMAGYFIILTFFSIALLYYANPINGKTNIRTHYHETVDSNRILSFHYDNLRGNKMISVPTIQSDILGSKDPFIKLFIPYTRRMELLLKDQCPIRKILDKEQEEDYEKYKNQASIDCISGSIDLKINGNEYPNDDFVFSTRSDKNTRGIQYYIPSNGLPDGKNTIEISADHFKENAEGAKIISIPFWFSKINKSLTILSL